MTIDHIPDGAARGLRRSTEAARAATRLADAFRGLPDGVTRWRLAIALRGAATRLGLTAPMLRLLEHYIDLTHDADWETGSEPVVTRPLVEIAEHLGRSERQVRNIERALVDKGLLAWRDSGNHRRQGRRDRRTGRLVFAYGPSLAPLGAQAGMVLSAAEAARAEAAERKTLRLAIAALRRQARADLDAAAARGATVADVIERLAAEPARERAGETLATLALRRERLSAICRTIGTRLETLEEERSRVRAETGVGAGLAEIRRRPSSDTEARQYFSTREASETPVARQGSERQPRLKSDPAPITLDLAIAAMGEDLEQGVLGNRPRDWRDLIEATRLRALTLGVDQETWGNACAAMGRAEAALCALVLDAAMHRPPGGAAPPVTRPSGYFQALIARAEQGTLRLDLSLRAIARRRSQKEGRRGRTYCDAGMYAGRDGAPTMSSGPS